MRRVLPAVLAVVLAAGSAVVGGLASRALAGERAPHCYLIKIEQPAPYRPLWLDACGTGSGGESWVRWGAAYKRGGPELVDGAHLSPATCTRKSPCVVLWPGSPQS